MQYLAESLSYCSTLSYSSTLDKSHVFIWIFQELPWSVSNLEFETLSASTLTSYMLTSKSIVIIYYLWEREFPFLDWAATAFEVVRMDLECTVLGQTPSLAFSKVTIPNSLAPVLFKFSWLAACPYVSQIMPWISTLFFFIPS